MRTYVYVAGPYSQGNPSANTRRAIDAAEDLRQRGLIPFVPHLSHFTGVVHDLSYEEWIDLDLAWVEACDCVLRLEGYSPGADREVAHAAKHGVRVFATAEQCVAYARELEEADHGE